MISWWPTLWIIIISHCQPRRALKGHGANWDLEKARKNSLHPRQKQTLQVNWAACTSIVFWGTPISRCPRAPRWGRELKWSWPRQRATISKSLSKWRARELSTVQLVLVKAIWCELGMVRHTVLRNRIIHKHIHKHHWISELGLLQKCSAWQIETWKQGLLPKDSRYTGGPLRAEITTRAPWRASHPNIKQSISPRRKAYQMCTTPAISRQAQVSIRNLLKSCRDSFPGLVKEEVDQDILTLPSPCRSSTQP